MIFENPQLIIRDATDLGDIAIKNKGELNGFMGVSIRHTFFSKNNMRKYISWGSLTFKEFTILLMDDPDRHNLKVFKDLSEEKALEKAREISNNTKTAYEKIIRDLEIDNVKIVQFQDFINVPAYEHILNEINSYIKINPEFQMDLYNLMQKNIGDRIEELIKDKNLTVSESDNLKQILINYIIEEISSIIYFTENGFRVEVDPTEEFSTKKHLYEGYFPDLGQILQIKKRGHVYAYPPNTSYYS